MKKIVVALLTFALAGISYSAEKVELTVHDYRITNNQAQVEVSNNGAGRKWLSLGDLETEPTAKAKLALLISEWQNEKTIRMVDTEWNAIAQWQVIGNIYP
jgi:hypothetical protein